MEVLALCSYPLEAAATRYRIMQFAEPLAERGINLTVSPFFDKDEFEILYKSGHSVKKAFSLIEGAGKRFFQTFKARSFDALFIQREAMILGPPVFEWLYKTVGKCPLILDLDDATYLSYISPTYGRLGSALKFFGKTDKLIDWSETVVCGNRHIAEYVESKGRRAVVVPTVVDTDKFYPIEKNRSETLVIGWIGTHSTFPLLTELFPVLEDLAKSYDFKLKIVGAGKDKIEIGGVKVENLSWKLEREIEDFQSLDVGLYPLGTTELVSKERIAGKSGFKAIQYMAVGIPFVVTPIGVCEEIGIKNETHFEAVSKEHWYESLAKLIESLELRKQMGQNGRDYALKHYTVAQQAEKIANAIQKAVINFKN